MSVKIGHASIDERGKINGGAAGDSTGKELCIRNWYANNWNVMLRPKNSELAEKSAWACAKGCSNDNIGYDQYQRNTLYKYAKDVNFDLSKITARCECDCSSFMHVCAIAGGANIDYGSNGLTTSTMVKAFVNSGDYEKYTDSKYLTSENYLKRGDILVKESGHTVMVLEDGNMISSNVDVNTSKLEDVVIASDRAQQYNQFIAGLYKVTASALHVRHGAGINKKNMVLVPRGTKVRSFGYYTTAWGVKWLYVQFTYNNVKYTGFCSSRYLSKI